MIPLSRVEDTNKPPLRENIVTVTMPGVTSTRSQLARYAGDEGCSVLVNNRRRRNINSQRSVVTIAKIAFRNMFSNDASPHFSGGVREQYIESDDDEEEEEATTAVWYTAKCRIAPRILHNIMASPEMDEISASYSLNPFHWVMSLKERLTHWWFATSLSPSISCHCEAGLSGVGGTGDQQTFTREVRRAVKMIQGLPLKKHLVLFGCSRGATTCFYSSMKLPGELAQHVSLVIVEAPFDTMDSVINTSCWFPALARWFFRTFCDYRGEADAAEAYSYRPDDVAIRCPVAFVISLKDKRVPNSCTNTLIESVRRDLVPHKIPALEILVLEHSRHPMMAVGCKEDQSAYVQFVEGLYAKYCT